LPGYTLQDGLTLKNRLGATNHEALEAAETDYVRNRLWDFTSAQGPKGQFDAAHLKAIHHHLFQDVYEWAGRTRDERVMLSDGTIASEPVLRKVDGQPFMQGPLIADTLERITGKLRDENYLRGLGREDFANRAAALMVDLNGVHPFREGNGRTQRVFITELAREAGHRLDFSVATRERLVQASIAGNENADPSMMQRLFNEVSDPVRVAALDKAIASLNQHGFDWNNHYVATTEPGHKVDVCLAGVASDQFMARTKTAILIGQFRDLPEPRPQSGQNFTLAPTSWDDERSAVINSAPEDSTEYLKVTEPEHKANYACKLCIWDKKLYGESFRLPDSWFRTPDDLLAHIQAEHPQSNWLSKDKPSWPGVLEDAQACAEGYLVCYHAFEPDIFSFTCYRCNATTINIEDLTNLYCLSCGHRFESYYTAPPWRH
jgi:cell filamentation protein